MKHTDLDVANEVYDLVLFPKDGSPYFDYSLRKLGNEATIFRTALPCPIFSAMIDGCARHADWDADVDHTLTETLFLRLQKFRIRTYTSYYLKINDDVDPVVDGTNELKASKLHPGILDVFWYDPADEGGPSFLGLLGKRRTFAVSFNCSIRDFSISIAGKEELVSEFKRSLYDS